MCVALQVPGERARAAGRRGLRARALLLDAQARPGAAAPLDAPLVPDDRSQVRSPPPPPSSSLHTHCVCGAAVDMNLLLSGDLDFDASANNGSVLQLKIAHLLVDLRAKSDRVFLY